MKRLLLILATVFLFNVCKAQNITSYVDTVAICLDDAIECVIFPKYIKDGTPEITEEWIQEVYESKEMRAYVRTQVAWELQSIVDYLKVTESDITYFEIVSIGINPDTNEYKFRVRIDYEDKTPVYYEAKNP